MTNKTEDFLNELGNYHMMIEKLEYTGKDNLEDCQVVYLGDIKPQASYTQDSELTLVQAPVCSGSDYSGTSVELSNYRYIEREFGDNPAVKFAYGGHGSYGVYIAPSLLDDKTKHDLADVFNSLDNYPIIDESLWSEVIAELEQEAIHSWIAYDLEREIDEVTEDTLYESIPFSTEALEKYFWYLLQKTGLDFTEESEGMYVDIEELAKGIDLDEPAFIKLVANSGYGYIHLNPKVDPMIVAMRHGLVEPMFPEYF